ncbi:hypothetical protein Asppvi_011095 [Aspergillus pseudoviridinutans]|uniref:Glycoside hydrolase 131 catalytic N-terminal domain-containing protein n=1 Tax=Aspergillus pseudoviridinutans TaxID=1517512 RepID=A0A9P3BKI9_9EURO|nr:uncharacterized protein Asppvi_011095 [Aspergillus pseudoviridinutans]GIJ92119.1 hypothetical protein Asppvi_011095 [Aspergillus pseudoviridinutans]
MRSFISLLAFPASSLAGTVLWSGIFNSSATVEDFDKWSWSNQIEPWQWYIHGSGKTTEYLGLSPDFKNPADTSDAQGVRITIDGTSFWNGQTMERSELIPQTKANLGSGHLYYHFSLSTKTTNAPDASFEHQIAFFESHFTELKYGASGTSDNTLRWNAGGTTHWSVQLEPGNWYNFAYDIDFASQKVGLWASNGSDPLIEVVSPVSASTSTNSADWHVGQLRLPNGGASNSAAEDWFWSGIYVEQAPITTKIGSAGSSGSSASSGSSGSSSSGASSASNPSASTPSTHEATPLPSSISATEPAATTAPPAVTSSASPAPDTNAARPTKPSSAVTSAAASAPNTPAATPTETSSAKLPTPTTAAQLLADIRAALRALVSRSNSVHARDFARRG